MAPLSPSSLLCVMARRCLCSPWCYKIYRRSVLLLLFEPTLFSHSFRSHIAPALQWRRRSRGHASSALRISVDQRHPLHGTQLPPLAQQEQPISALKSDIITDTDTGLSGGGCVGFYAQERESQPARRIGSKPRLSIPCRMGRRLVQKMGMKSKLELGSAIPDFRY